MDGIRAAEQIRSHFDCAFIFLTAYGDRATKAQMRRVNPVAILHKPADGREIQAALEEVGRAASR